MKRFAEFPRDLVMAATGTGPIVPYLPISATLVRVACVVLLVSSVFAAVGFLTRIASISFVVPLFYFLTIPQLYGKITHVDISFWSQLVLYVSFIEWTAIACNAYRRRRVPLIFAYDGSCGTCRTTATALARLALPCSVQFTPAQELAATNGPAVPDLAALMSEIHVITPKGSFRGFAAYRRVAWRIPVFWPIIPLLYVPPVPWSGERIYGAILQRRQCAVGAPVTDGAPTAVPRERRNSDPWTTVPTYVGGVILALALAAIGAGVVDSWPIALYPTFAGLSAADHSELRIEENTLAGGQATVSLANCFTWMTSDRYAGLVNDVISRPKETRSEALLSFLGAASRTCPSLADPHAPSASTRRQLQPHRVMPVACSTGSYWCESVFGSARPPLVWRGRGRRGGRRSSRRARRLLRRLRCRRSCRSSRRSCRRGRAARAGSGPISGSTLGHQFQETLVAPAATKRSWTWHHIATNAAGFVRAWAPKLYEVPFISASRRSTNGPISPAPSAPDARSRPRLSPRSGERCLGAAPSQSQPDKREQQRPREGPTAATARWPHATGPGPGKRLDSTRRRAGMVIRIGCPTRFWKRMKGLEHSTFSRAASALGACAGT